MASQVKNVTFSLPVDLIDKLKDYANHNYIPSVNAAVREALEEYSHRMEKERLHQEMLKAAHDPLFMMDLADSMRSFSESDHQTNRGLPEW